LIVYFISGLGADERVFQKLQLPIDWKLKHIVWDKISDKENLKSYCLKLSKQINIQEEFYLVGVSFGGIVAIEFSKIINPKKIVIISSISSQKQLPKFYKVVNFFKVQNIVPVIFFKQSISFYLLVFWSK